MSWDVSQLYDSVLWKAPERPTIQLVFPVCGVGQRVFGSDKVLSNIHLYCVLPLKRRKPEKRFIIEEASYYLQY